MGFILGQGSRAFRESRERGSPLMAVVPSQNAELTALIAKRWLLYEFDVL